jgi:hypothetical protein
VNFTQFYGTMKSLENPQLAFATHVMMEIPEQYATIKKLRLLHKGGVSSALPTIVAPSAPLAPPASTVSGDSPPSYAQSQFAGAPGGM